jgi:uncharacterized protein (DUF2237 family)
MSDNIEFPKNVLGTPITLCCNNPKTGFFRDGYCRTNNQDLGSHVVCAIVTKDFLEFTKSKGNDLSTPRPEFNFPGLIEGSKWCLCAVRWKEALEAGVAPPVDLNATHEKTLEYISIEDLKRHQLN